MIINVTCVLSNTCLQFCNFIYIFRNISILNRRSLLETPSTFIKDIVNGKGKGKAKVIPLQAWTGP